MNDGPVNQSAPALSAKEAWAVCSTELSQADDETIAGSWLSYLQCSKKLALNRVQSRAGSQS